MSLGLRRYDRVWFGHPALDFDVTIVSFAVFASRPGMRWIHNVSRPLIPLLSRSESVSWSALSAPSPAASSALGLWRPSLSFGSLRRSKDEAATYTGFPTPTVLPSQRFSRSHGFDSALSRPALFHAGDALGLFLCLQGCSLSTRGLRFSPVPALHAVSSLSLLELTEVISHRTRVAAPRSCACGESVPL